MKLTKRWRWLGVEFLVIALGVLAALFVDMWVENRENIWGLPPLSDGVPKMGWVSVAN